MSLFQVVLLIALGVWLLAIISAYQYGRIGRLLLQTDKTLSAVNADLPPLSVVIATHNQAPALRRHLPAILNQDYDRFEVIVIDMASTDETKDVLERLELQYACLRHTFTPASARDISIERLALTLGFRAASNDWVVIIHPDCEPVSSQWLLRIGEIIAHPKHGWQSPRLKEPNMVLGIARYDKQRSTWIDLQTSFYRLWYSIASVHHILNGHAAVRADACNLAFRKSYFLDCGGFADTQDMQAGAEELLVNHTSTPSNTALLLSPAAIVVQDRVGSERIWRQQRVFYAETRRHQRHATLYRFTQTWKQILPWLVLLCLVLPLIACVLLCFTMQDDPLSTHLYILVGVLTTLLFTYVVTKLTNFRKTSHAWGCRNYYLSLFLLELELPLWNLSARLSRRFTAHNEFRKKFV